MPVRWQWQEKWRYSWLPWTSESIPKQLILNNYLRDVCLCINSMIDFLNKERGIFCFHNKISFDIIINHCLFGSTVWKLNNVEKSKFSYTAKIETVMQHCITNVRTGKQILMEYRLSSLCHLSLACSSHYESCSAVEIRLN